MMGIRGDYFPYGSYRPHQQDMLDMAAACAREGGIGMIDAPTGSGKSSVVSAFLEEANGRKVIVAVRTVSQLNTFVRELELVRKKHPNLRYSYLVGKRQMCPMAGEGDTYRVCEGLKAFSSSLMRERARKGAHVPAKDKVIEDQIRRQDAEHPLLCPYFIRSRVFIEGADGLRMVPSGTLKSRAEQVARTKVTPDRLHEFSKGLCPYEVMLQAARDADVILLNFYHLFDTDIRDQLYQSLGIEAENALLIVDEAHNCGSTVESIQSVTLFRASLDQGMIELGRMRGRVAGADALLNMLPRVGQFMDSLQRSFKEEDWFDPANFVRFVLTGSLYQRIDDIVDDLLKAEETYHEAQKQSGDFKESAVERLTAFFYRIMRSLDDPAFLTLYRKKGEEISLQVRNIDPSSTLKDIASYHACAIFISGTLSPVESYRRLYFEDLPVQTLSLPNAFPKENRALFCAKDVTSTYRMRRDAGNMERIEGYIRSFATLHGSLAVYFPSYELLERFTANLPSRLNRKRVFIESSSSSDAAEDLREFMSLPSRGEYGIIFGVCGGKWSEGLDYRGELLSGALVLGLPLAPFTEVRRMTNQYFKNKFGKEGEFISYTMPAINRVLQALGRVLRTPEDRGVLMIGESRFLETEVHGGLPPWMQEEMIPCTLSSFSEEAKQWR
ncbi:ATP-dependent DNA helicase [Methanogenium organophilum]|nr:ATP-dependent DNA helicase [Methanogenium organophilum]